MSVYMQQVSPIIIKNILLKSRFYVNIINIVASDILVQCYCEYFEKFTN